jgi:hypothetical protein
MSILRHKALYPMFTEPHRQTVDQETDLAAGIFIAVETQGARPGFFRQQRLQADQVETKAGVQRVGQRIQLLGEKPQHHLGIAQGFAGPNRNARHLAVGAEEGGLQQARTAPFALQNAAQTLRQAEQ